MTNTTLEAPIRAKKSPAQPTTKAAAPAEESLHGHTPRQIELAFHQIATMANTLRNYLAGEAEDADIYLANIVACQIGSVADCMSGYDILGNPAAWTINTPYDRAAAKADTLVTPISPPPADDCVPSDDEECTLLSLQCVTEIQGMASALRVIEEAHSDEDSPFVFGVCERVTLLSEIIFKAMRLHELTDDDAGPTDINHLRAVFEGRLA